MYILDRGILQWQEVGCRLFPMLQERGRLGSYNEFNKKDKIDFAENILAEI